MKYIWKTAHILIILALISVFACGTGFAAYAAADSASLDFGQTGSVSLSLEDGNGNAVSDGAVTIYEVAVLSLEDGSMAYTYTEAFSGCTLTLDIEDNTLAAALAEYVAENKISGTAVDIDADGTVLFEGLELGLYLVVQTTQSTGYNTISPFLVTVPYAEGDSWVYDVDASPKVEVSTDQTEETPGPSEEPSEEPSEKSSEEPSEETTEEPSAGPSEEITASPDSTKTPTTTSSSGSGSSTTLPQTGQLNWPVPVLAVSGLVFFAVGWCMYVSGRRKRSHAE